MVRNLDVATQTAIRTRSAIVPRNFIVCVVRTLDTGAPVTFAFSDFGEDVTTNIIDALTGVATSYFFSGDNAPVVSMDAVPLKIGVEVDTTQIVLNALHPAVAAMVRGHDCRNGQVQIHRGFLSPESMLLVAEPRCRRLGFINGAPITTPAIGQTGSVTLKVVSASRELTRINSARGGEDFYAARSDDRWGRYASSVKNWPIWWGEEKGTAG